MPKRTPEHVEVVVVGAGLAGLSAARRIRKEGRTATVIEARDEVGGRTRSREIDGRVVDFGGEWIGRAHKRMRSLVEELGLHIEPARNLGHHILWRLPSGHTCRRLPPLQPMLDMARIVARAARDSWRVDPDAPWAGPRAHMYDTLSAREWIEQSDLSRDGRYVFDRLVGSLSCQSMDAMSLLHLLWLVRLAGDPIRTFATTFQWRIAEGAQQVSRRIAGEFGESIYLGVPVREVHQGDDGVEVVGDGLRVHARRAIVATPVPQVANISFEPPLPAELRQLSELHLGAGTKVIARLPASHAVKQNTVLGGHPLWGAWRRGDTVTGFVPPMAGDVPDDDLIADLAAAFGVASPAALRDPTVFRWAEQDYIAGCDAAFAPGQVCRFGPQLAAPHGLVRFAGVARSSWPDNMEGAVRSGEQAAAEVLATLSVH